MKAILFASAALVTLAAPALAQSTIIERRIIETPSPAPGVEPLDDEDLTGTVEIDPDQEVVIRRRVIEEQPAPSVIEIPRGQVTIGSAVPGDIPLRPMSRFGSQGLANLAYFVSPDQKIVVVEPQTRRVVKIIRGQ
ncbi:MAG: DUF1236 domain-containing protein [Alsobacter sp.]